jgi:hypothetical protein
MAHESIRELLNRSVDQAEYRAIRRLWLEHSLAEDRRDIPGLMATLTDDCIYEMVQTGHSWPGHEGATQFYTEMLGAFPDVHFDLINIVIGPQGVWEEAVVTGTHQGHWLGWPPTGKQISLKTTILFPWDPATRKFKGERIYLDSDESLRGDVPTRLTHGK